MNRIPWMRAVICICFGVGLAVFAGLAGAETAVIETAATAVSAPEVGAYDAFVFAGEISASVQTGCTSCGIIDACLDKHPNEQCKPTDPACRCKTCNGYFECYK